MGTAHRAAWMIGATVLMIGSGCSSPDSRLADASERSANRQRAQNELIAQQSEAVTAQNQRIAEAARELVAKDAEARQQLIQAQRQLHAELHAERSSIDRQRAALESERRDLAVRRQRDPVIAEAIRDIGTLLACLVPLVLAGYALSCIFRDGSDAEALGELLVQELVSENPKLLPPSQQHALGHHPGDRSEDPYDPPPDDKPNLPF